MTRCIGAVACLWAVGFGAMGSLGVAVHPRATVPSSRLLWRSRDCRIHRGEPCRSWPAVTLVLGVTATAFAAVAGSWWCPAVLHRRISFWRRQSVVRCRRCCSVSPPTARLLHRDRGLLDGVGDRRGGCGTLAGPKHRWCGAGRRIAGHARCGGQAVDRPDGPVADDASAAEASDDGTVPAGVRHRQSGTRSPDVDGTPGRLVGIGRIGCGAGRRGPTRWACAERCQSHRGCLRGAAPASTPAARSHPIRCGLRGWNGQCFCGFCVDDSLPPRYAHWVCLIAVVLGVGAVFLTIADLGTRLSPVARRSLELLDYVALASAVPLACWVGDVFGIVRSSNLP